MNNSLKIITISSFTFFLISCGGSVKPTKNTDSSVNPSVVMGGAPIIIDNRPKDIVLSNNERFSGALDAHNSVRSKHGLAPLSWSNDLAKISQKWADNLGKGNSCQMYHTGGNPPFGENLYRASAIMWSDGRRDIQRVNIKNVVKAWTDEEQWYDYQNNSCQPGKQCGHYTQAVWKGTTEVGCAMKVCGDKSQSWVCSYFPAGNIVGARPY